MSLCPHSFVTLVWSSLSSSASGTSQDELASSPFAENLLSKGYEVIYFSDVLDEYVMQHLQNYEGKSFANAAKDGLKLTDSDEKDEEKKAKVEGSMERGWG